MGILIGIGKVETGSGNSITFNTLGFELKHSFPTYMPKIRGNELELVAAGTKKTYAVIPQYAIGLYLSANKIDKLLNEKTLTNLAVPTGTSKSDKMLPFLALKLKFIKNINNNQEFIDPIYDTLYGGKNNDYRKSLENFKLNILKQMGNSNKSKSNSNSNSESESENENSKGIKKGDEMEFLFVGDVQLGISYKGQDPVFVDNSDLRRRLINIFAGEQSICKELPSTLKKTFLEIN